MRTGQILFAIWLAIGAMFAVACKDKISFTPITGTIPTVATTVPNRGPASGGTTITVTGTNFVAPMTVTIDGIDCTNVVVTSATELVCDTPAGTEGVKTLRVFNSSNEVGTLNDGFTYGPTIETLTPAASGLAGGITVTIAGSGFDTVGTTTVDFGANPGTNVTVASATRITCTAPAGSAGTVDVTVTNPSGIAHTRANGFEYTNVTAVTGISPNTGSALGGTAVTITGANFTGATAVTIGGNPATGMTVVDDNTITATTPAGTSGPADVVVTAPTGTDTLTGGFTYNNPPTVSAISPVGGSTLGGTSVTITGSDFVAGATVSIGGVTATNVAVVNNTTITTTTGVHGAGAVDVTVTNPDTQADTLANGFTYGQPPQVTGTCPMNGEMFASPYLTRITVRFDQTPDPATIVAANFTMAGFTLTPTLNGNDVELAISPALAASTAYTITVAAAVTNAAGIQLDGNSDGRDGDAATFGFSTGTAGTIFGKTRTDLGQADGDSATFGSVAAVNRAMAFFDDSTPLHAEVIFVQDRKVAPVTPATVTFSNSNPDSLTVTGAPDLTTIFAPGSTVTVTGSLFNNRTYTVASVTATMLTMIGSDFMFNESNVSGVTLEGTLGRPQLMRQTWTAGTGLGTAAELDAGATNAIVGLENVVAASGASACVMRRTTESGGTQALHGFVYASGTGWTNAATAQLATGHPGWTSANAPQLAMRGDVPVVMWIDADGNAISSEFTGGAWAHTPLYTNPTAGDPTTAALFVGGTFFGANHGAIGYAIADTNPGDLQYFGFAYNATLRPGNPIGSPFAIFSGDTVATLGGVGSPVAVHGDSAGNFVIYLVLEDTADRVQFRRYDAAADTVTALQTAYVSNSGAGGVDVFSFTTGQNVGGGDRERDYVARPILVGSIDGHWLIVQDDDTQRTISGSQFDATGNSFANSRTFAIPGLTGLARAVKLFQEFSGDAHLFVLKEITPAGADAEVHHFFFDATANAWNANALRVDDSTDIIPQGGTPADYAARIHFDNVWGTGTGNGFARIDEQTSGGRLRVYVSRYTDSNQTWGAAARVGNAGGFANERDGLIFADMPADAVAFWRHETFIGTEARLNAFIGCDGGWQSPTSLQGSNTNVRAFVDRRMTNGTFTGTWSVIEMAFGSGTGEGTRMFLQILTD